MIISNVENNTAANTKINGYFMATSNNPGHCLPYTPISASAMHTLVTLLDLSVTAE
jgi:hypothetical protein